MSHPDGYGDIVHLDDDQPTCCPKCQSRTNWVDGIYNLEEVRLHDCLGCGHKFMSQDDPDFGVDDQEIEEVP